MSDVEELFYQICIPEIFSAVLRHLTLKERRNLRVCSRFFEDAVSRSDMHVCGHRNGYRQAIWREPNTMCISANFTRRTDSRVVELALSLGGTTILRRRHKDEPFSKDNYRMTLTEIMHLRKRLCSRIFVDRVAIIDVNFNIVSMDYIESLLGSCVFNDLTIIVKKGGYCHSLIDLLRKNESKEVCLTLQGFTIDSATLLSLKPMEELIISKTYYATEYDIDFLNLVKKGHTNLRLPSITRTSSNFIQKVIEEFFTRATTSLNVEAVMMGKDILRKKAVPKKETKEVPKNNMGQTAYQWVEFKVGLGVAEFFLLQIGFIWDGRYMLRIGQSDYTTVRNYKREYSSYLISDFRRTCGLKLEISFPKYRPGPGRRRPKMVRISICRDPSVTDCAQCKSKHCAYAYHDDKHVRTAPPLN